MKNAARSNRSVSRIVYIITAVQFVAIVILFGVVFQLRNSTNKTAAELKQQNLQFIGEVNYQKSQLRPIILPKEKLVVFPELNISLPYNLVTKTLQYNFDEESNLRVTSTLINEPYAGEMSDMQISCAELVRINPSSGTPYSPWEEAAGSVQLGGEKTIHIITAKAFKNNQASTEECARKVWLQVTPQQVADEFKKAQSL